MKRKSKKLEYAKRSMYSYIEARDAKMRMQPFNLERVRKAKELRAEGLKQHEIATILGISQSWLSILIKRHDTTKSGSG